MSWQPPTQDPKWNSLRNQRGREHNMVANTSTAVLGDTTRLHVASQQAPSSIASQGTYSPTSTFMANSISILVNTYVVVERVTINNIFLNK